MNEHAVPPLGDDPSVCAVRSDGYRGDPPADQSGREPSPDRTPAGIQSVDGLARRRIAFAAAVIATEAALAACLLRLIGYDGFDALDAVLLLTFLLSSLWPTIGFWNAVVGFWLATTARDPEAVVVPLRRSDPDAAVAGRVALVLAIRNEDPAGPLSRLAGMLAALSRTPDGGRFDAFVLSDSSRPEIIAAEEALVAEWRLGAAEPAAVHYRRRLANTGFKAGNIREFIDGEGVGFDLMIPLDADSLMTADTILWLVRLAEANPRIGILQSLVVGRPAATVFTRLFQFGMRHGMRAYTLGSAWWLGDCGPYWGHNAVVRVAPFRDHCRLPELPGRPPLGGPILSHDQVEAALMRRGGYEVRVIPRECGSYEENPPTLLDFLKRELRWCQGNLQYFGLLGMRGLVPTSRVQLALAILMYLGAAAWVGFIAAGTLRIFLPQPTTEPFPAGLGVAMFVTVVLMSLAPKLAGIVDCLLRGEQRLRYGGGARLVLSALAEIAMSVLIAPVMAFAETLFMLGLPFGRRVTWDAQQRAGGGIAWSRAFGRLWPGCVAGIGLAALLAEFAPGALPWAAPLVLGLVLAPAIAVVTAAPMLGRWAVQAGLGAIPEEYDPFGAHPGIGDEPPAAAPELRIK